jgi:hypothetical protein
MILFVMGEKELSFVTSPSLSFKILKGKKLHAQLMQHPLSLLNHYIRGQIFIDCKLSNSYNI